MLVLLMLYRATWRCSLHLIHKMLTRNIGACQGWGYPCTRDQRQLWEAKDLDSSSMNPVCCSVRVCLLLPLSQPSASKPVMLFLPHLYQQLAVCQMQQWMRIWVVQNSDMLLPTHCIDVHSLPVDATSCLLLLPSLRLYNAVMLCRLVTMALHSTSSHLLNGKDLTLGCAGGTS